MNLLWFSIIALLTFMYPCLLHISLVNISKSKCKGPWYLQINRFFFFTINLVMLTRPESQKVWSVFEVSFDIFVSKHKHKCSQNQRLCWPVKHALKIWYVHKHWTVTSVLMCSIPIFLLMLLLANTIWNRTQQKFTWPPLLNDLRSFEHLVGG